MKRSMIEADDADLHEALRVFGLALAWFFDERRTRRRAHSCPVA
jgi:hypothetical protein